MTPLLEVENLSKTFAGKRVLAGVSFHVGEGEVVGFIGPNGAGKSTTMKIMCGLLRSETGTVRLGGFDLRRDPRNFLARIGVLIESPGCYPSLCAFDHLAWLARLRGCYSRELVTQALRSVGLSPESRKPVKQFSMGMKQRLGIAMATIHSPRLLILDEPMNGLDPAGMVQLREFIRELCRSKGVSTFVSSHLLHEVEQVCDRVVFIRDGRLLSERTLSRNQLAEEGRLWLRTGDDARAAEVLRALEFIHEVQCETEGLECRLAAADFPRVPAALVAAGIPLREMTPRRETLEEVYLANYAGRRKEIE